MDGKRYFVYLSYKGTNYHGWQVQPNAITIQSELNRIFSTFFRENIEITGAGRTDTGVHAKFFVAHFNSANIVIKHTDTLFKLNNFLPADIALYEICRVTESAHSRYDALSREYQYIISRFKNPFNRELSYYYNYPLDINKMQEAARILSEYTDFGCFCKSGANSKTNICHIMETFWTEHYNTLIFTIKADRFLRNMVRAIVGTMLEVGRKKINISKFRKIIESKDRSNAGFSVPPQGLFLTNIQYPDSVFIEKQPVILCKNNIY